MQRSFFNRRDGQVGLVGELAGPRTLAWVGRTLVMLAWCGVAAVAQAEVVTLSPIEDATISEKSLTAPLGREITIDSGTTGPLEGVKRNRALLRFELAGRIPSNAQVTSVALNLTVVQTPPVRTNLPFTLHKVLRPWNGNAVTWTNRLSPPEPWSVEGGAPPLDYSSSVTHSNLINERGPYMFASNPGLVADVQDWVRNPDRNFGWILLCGIEDLERSVRKFGASEAATASTRPALEVQFALPTNECPKITTPSFTTAEDIPIALTGLVTDADGDPITYTFTQPVHGAIALTASRLIYTPTPNYHGSDHFTVTATDGLCSADGLVSLQVEPVNDIPVARIRAGPSVDLSPEFIHPVVISPNDSNALIHLDGLLSSDVESPFDTLTAAWLFEPVPTPFAIGFVHDQALELGTHLIVLMVTDPAGAAGEDRLMVDVLGVSEVIEELIDVVNASAIERGRKRALIATLKAVVAASERGQRNAAANQLRAFQNKVRAQVEREHPAEAEKWLHWSQAVMQALVTD